MTRAAIRNLSIVGSRISRMRITLLVTVLSGLIALQLASSTFFDRRAGVVDTLLLSRLFHADILAVDQRRKWKNMPLQLYGRHSLEAYGHRLNCYKESLARLPTGPNGLQKWKPTWSKMLLLPPNFGSISNDT